MMSEDLKTGAEHLVVTRSLRLGAWLLTSAEGCSATWRKVELRTKDERVPEQDRQSKRWAA